MQGKPLQVRTEQLGDDLVNGVLSRLVTSPQLVDRSDLCESLDEDVWPGHDA